MEDKGIYSDTIVYWSPYGEMEVAPEDAAAIDRWERAKIDRSDPPPKIKAIYQKYETAIKKRYESLPAPQEMNAHIQ